MNKRLLASLTVVVSMFLPFSYSVLLADTSANPTALSASSSKKLTKWFFSVRTPEAMITKNNGVFIVHLKNPSIIALPTTSHTTRNVSLQEFVQGWGKGSFSYKAVNPNAVLDYGVLNKVHDKATYKMFGIVVVLSNPVISGTTLSFNISTSKTSDESSLFLNKPIKGVTLQIGASDPAFFGKE